MLSGPIFSFLLYSADNNIGEHLFAELDAGLEKAGLVYWVGAIVDAAIVATPSSTKNEKK